MTAPGISTRRIDWLYDATFVNGVLAGKVSSAGGVGFAVFLVHPQDRLGTPCALNNAGGSTGSAKFAERGCEP